MARFETLLIKLGHDERFRDWTIDSETVPISYATFSEILLRPGYPTYSCQRSLQDKWRMLDTLHLVQKKVHKTYFLNVGAIRRYIEDTMPEICRRDPTRRAYYLRTGQVMI